MWWHESSCFAGRKSRAWAHAELRAMLERLAERTWQTRSSLPIEEAFDRVARTGNSLTIDMGSRPTASGVIHADGVSGHVIFPDDRLYSFFYVPAERAIYWDALAGRSDNVWRASEENRTAGSYTQSIFLLRERIDGVLVASVARSELLPLTSCSSSLPVKFSDVAFDVSEDGLLSRPSDPTLGQGFDQFFGSARGGLISVRHSLAFQDLVALSQVLAANPVNLFEAFEARSAPGHDLLSANSAVSCADVVFTKYPSIVRVIATYALYALGGVRGYARVRGICSATCRALPRVSILVSPPLPELWGLNEMVGPLDHRRRDVELFASGTSFSEHFIPLVGSGWWQERPGQFRREWALTSVPGPILTSIRTIHIQGYLRDTLSEPQETLRLRVRLLKAGALDYSSLTAGGSSLDASMRNDVTGNFQGLVSEDDLSLFWDAAPHERQRGDHFFSIDLCADNTLIRVVEPGDRLALTAYMNGERDTRIMLSRVCAVMFERSTHRFKQCISSRTILQLFNQDVGARILDFLDARALAALRASCRVLNAAVGAFAIAARPLAKSSVWHRTAAGDDEQEIVCVRLVTSADERGPSSLGAVISAGFQRIMISGMWRDQGFGNKKGHLVMRRNNDETSQWISPRRAPHELQHFCFTIDPFHPLFQSNHSGETFSLRGHIGSGGGHSLTIHDLTVVVVPETHVQP